MTSFRFFEKLDIIDSHIDAAETIGFSESFQAISYYLDDKYICQYFFGKLESEKWLDVIITSDFYKNYRSGKNASLQNYEFDWYLTGYLVKVADRNVSLSSDYIKSIMSIDDEHLHHRMIEIMLKLAPADTISLVVLEKEWLKSKRELYGSYSEYAGKLILHAQECDEDIAFEMLQEILKISAITRESGQQGSDSYYKRIEVKARFSEWEYQSVLEKYASKFIANSVDSTQYVGFLFDLLSRAISLEKEEVGNDYSWVWRNTLEDNEQTRHVSGLKEHLLVFVRDLLISLVSADRENFSFIVSGLSKYEWSIFQRLSIYLVVKFPFIDQELTDQLVGNTSLYEDSKTRNEYSLLLDSAFGMVSSSAQNLVYSWIDSNAGLDNYIHWYEKQKGDTPSDEAVDDYRSHWKKTRLYLIRNHIQNERLAEYEALIEEKGAPDHPEYSSYTTSWVGPVSPISAEELNGLEISELISRLKEWKPAKEDMAPSPEGLSRSLSEAVKSNVEKYKNSASLFMELPPTYVHGLLQGLSDGRASLDQESWSGIVKLSAWVLSQEPISESDNQLAYDEDSGWAGCRQTIARLLDLGFQKGDGQIPVELKEQVWNVLVSLTQDPDPTPAHEAEYGGSNMEPTNLAINTVRGEAMHAVVNYGLWVARNTKDKEITFNEIPEMREVLDAHLDPEFDPSLAVRSVYGQFYPWLNLIDTDWANDAKTRIFSDESGLGDAAWNAYVTFCQPYDDTYRVISDIYLKYAGRLSETNSGDDRDRSLEHFAGHIVTYYWRSKINLEDEIMRVFYDHAPLHLRKYAIEFIGRSLRNTPDGLENKIEERLKAFYEWRQLEAGKSGEYEELEGYCWWIDADVVDRDWALSKFYELLKVAETLDSLDFAARKLGNYLPENPSIVLECIEMMLMKLNNSGMHFSWDDEAMEILKQALSLEEVRDQAVELVHKFGSKGFLKYRELLSS